MTRPRPLTRRAVISALGVSLIAGCTGQESPAETETTADESSSTDDQSEPSEPAADDTAEPAADEPSYTTPTLEITDPPEAFQPAFDKSTVVFGIRLVGTEDVSETKFRHAAAVMAEYLDTDEDGAPDNPAVVDSMVERQATLIIPYDEAELEEVFDFLSESLPPARAETVQDLHAVEIHPDGLPYSSTGNFDATLEEVLHLITQHGFAQAYPDVFGEQVGSEIAAAMDTARGGQFETVPDSYPSEAWYTYDDRSCDYGCQITEYTYWAATSLMGGQSVGDRPQEIDIEWQLATRQAVEDRDPAVVEILSDPTYSFPLTLPDGTYTPTAE